MISLVTGCSGFIGSNLSEQILKNQNIVIGMDIERNLQRMDDIIGKPNFLFLQNDVKKIDSYISVLKDVDKIYHLAASSDIKRSLYDYSWDLQENVVGTHAVLELARKLDIDKFIFTSTSVVHGEDAPKPTPELGVDFNPISQYAASKISAEMFVRTYANIYGIKSWIFRFANVVGKHAHRGVIYDFLNKLKMNKYELEILGDGNQIKSYFHVSDCINALFEIPANDNNDNVEVYNIATFDTKTVKELADIVCDELRISPEYKFTGGDRGWIGDVPVVELDIKKALNTGWKPRLDCEQSIRKTVGELNAEVW